MTTIQALPNAGKTGEHVKPGTLVRFEDLQCWKSKGPGFKSTPRCPDGGSYGAGITIGAIPTCSLGTQGDADPENDHVLRDQ